jgi:hypothetical protein
MGQTPMIRKKHHTQPCGKNQEWGLPTCARRLRHSKLGIHIVNLKINRGSGSIQPNLSGST